LRDDIARPLHHDRIADPHILARDLVLIVHRDVLHHDAAPRHRLDMRDRSERAGATDIDGDALDLALDLFGGEFVSDRPARATRHETEPVLQIQPVHFVNDTVDVVAETGAGVLNLRVESKRFFDGTNAPDQRIDRKAPGFERLQNLPMGLAREFRCFAPMIGEETQGPARGDGGIELTQRTRRGVPRVGEDLVAGFFLAPVHRREIGMAHIDLATDLEDVGDVAPAKVLGHVGNGAQIRGHVLPFRPIAPRGPKHEFAVLVTQAGGQPVDLWLGHQGQLFIRGKREKTAHTCREIVDVFAGKGIVERKHGPGMAHLLETLGGFRAYAMRGAVVADEFRKAFLDFVVAQAQQIIIGVGNRRRVVLIIAFVVRRDFFGQTRQLAFGFRFAQLIRRFVFQLAHARARFFGAFCA
jgi:hypothetical protein